LSDKPGWLPAISGGEQHLQPFRRVVQSVIDPCSNYRAVSYGNQQPMGG
jgi:hypothetical protein